MSTTVLLESDPIVAAGPRLDPFYYLNNFQAVLSSLIARYADLLNAQEREFIQSFSTAPVASRALLVRMVMRRGELFRGSQLRYAEIGETAAAIAPLLTMGWVDAQPNLTIDQLQKLMTKPELVRYFGLSARDGAKKKTDLVELLSDQFPHAQPFEHWCTGSGDGVYHLLVSPLCNRLRLMFFGNFYQDWSEFVLADLGVFSYEKIQLSMQSRAFRSRAQLDVFERLHQCRELLQAGVPLDAVIAVIPGPIPDCDWLEDRRQKTMFRVARACERAADPASALAMYSHCSYPGARARQIRLHERLQQWDVALALGAIAQENPEDEVERQQLRRLIPRLKRKLGLPAVLERCNTGVSRFDLILDEEEADCSVEYRVRNFLAQQEPAPATVHYVENALINSLFGLLCWNAIFAPVSGAFFHDYHHGPADLSSKQFYSRRRREFAACFAQLESGEYQETIRRTHADKTGISSPFVAWSLLNQELLDCALACFPVAHLRRWFDWMVQDIQVNCAGFPDLVQFWPLERRYRMIEVKGPGDRLQDNQRRFLEYCASYEMPVSVCYVGYGQTFPTTLYASLRC